MRAFKIWNKDRTSYFDLSSLDVITTNTSGLGNKFSNDLYEGRVKKYLISQYNDFEQISLTINFGVVSEAYDVYRNFMNFIQANKRNILVLEYFSLGFSRYVDVVLNNSTKNQKTTYGVLVETVNFERLTPYYIKYRRTGTSILVSNSYMENVLPKITMRGRTYPTGTKIRVKSKNEVIPDLTDKTQIASGIYRFGSPQGITLDYDFNNKHFILNGTVETQGGSRITQNFDIDGNYVYSLKKIKGFKSEVFTTQFYSAPDDVFNLVISDDAFYSRYQLVINRNGFINVYFGTVGITFDNYTFTLQLENTDNNFELDRPIDELNGYTLREVFSNRNIGMPDLTTATDLGGGWYRYNTEGGINRDFNVLTGHVRLNGTNTWTNVNLNLFSNVLPNDTVVSFTYEYVSGTVDVGTEYIALFPNYTNSPASMTLKVGTYYPIEGLRENYLSAYNAASPRIYLGTGQTTFYAFTFKIQLEKGSKATPYQVPTSGPYNQFNFGLLDLTSEQINYYGNLYNTLLQTPTEYAKPITETIEVELAESVLANQTLVIDSENKTVTLNGANAYQITNKDKSTFLNLPEGDYLVECDTPIAVEYKRWVID